MRKMVIHFGPDSEGSGTQKHDIRDVDPASSIPGENVGTQHKTVKPVVIEEEPSWRDLLSRKLADKVRRAERIIDGLTMGMVLLKQMKGTKRRKKVLIGAVVVAGVAGATYLRMRSKRR